MSAAKINALETQSLKTFDNLAFAVCSQPGQLDAGRSQQVMDGAFHALTIGLESMMRQLSYEAITVAVQPSGYALSHNKKGRSSDSHLQSEMKGFENNLHFPGFTLQGDYEPARAGSTSSRQCWKKGAPRYLPLPKCISREQELQSQHIVMRMAVLPRKLSWNQRQSRSTPA